MKKISPVRILTDGVMTGTSVLTTAGIGIQDIKSCAFQFVWTGTAEGTFAIEGSVDGTNWSDMGLTISAAAGTAGNRIADITAVGVSAVRATYTNTASTGTLQVWFVGKSV